MINNNKDNLKIIIESKEQNIIEYLSIKTKKKALTIKIKEIKTINNNINSMFSFCESLLLLPDISKWNNQNITNMSYIFEGCNSLKSPDISKWNTTNMSHSLKELPDISKWNNQNVTNMSHMFSGCNSLKELI